MHVWHTATVVVLLCARLPSVLSSAGVCSAEEHARATSPKRTVTDSTRTLNDGSTIPRVGLGVYETKPGNVTYKAVMAALKLGYRHIDSAALYDNEQSVGEAVRDSGIPRSEIYITTKLWTMSYRGQAGGGEAFATRKAEESLARLGTYADLYLLHSPHHPAERLGFWRALESLKQRGKVKSIGVSNYGVAHIDELLAHAVIPPAINQIEINPFGQRKALAAHCETRGIAVEAYSPLARAEKLQDPTVLEVARGVGKSAAQVMIRWSLQKGHVSLPKSQRPDRIRENADVFNWSLSDDEMSRLDGLEAGLWLQWDPTTGP